MNPRERILAAINHQPLDRVPTDIWATQEVLDKLQNHFGDDMDIYSALHIDGIIRYSDTKYIGPELAKVAENERIDYWQFRFRQTDYGTGTYEEQYDYPLASAESIDDLKAYQWPQTEWFDYEALRKPIMAAHRKHVVQVGYMAPFYYHNMLRGLEKSLMDPLIDPEFTHFLLDKVTDFFFRHYKKMFETYEGLVDITQVTDDFGMQESPMISMDVFRDFYKPCLKKLIDMTKEFGIKVFHHDDGAIRPFIPELIEIGIDVLNPVQWTCPGMELEGLKKDFGRDICFHGGVENQKILPFGTPQEVREEVRHNIINLASDQTGYILASCHNLQPNTPIENILAMYDEAYYYGKF